MPNPLDDKDSFTSGDPTYDLKRHLWEQITGHARAQGLNWREMGDRLRELAYDCETQANEADTENMIDEVTPEDLPPRL